MLDVCPDSFSHLPGWKEAVEERAKVGPCQLCSGPVCRYELLMPSWHARPHFDKLFQAVQPWASHDQLACQAPP